MKNSVFMAMLAVEVILSCTAFSLLIRFFTVGILIGLIFALGVTLISALISLAAYALRVKAFPESKKEMKNFVQYGILTSVVTIDIFFFLVILYIQIILT